MALDKVVVLVGGVGGAKLAYGLACILPPESLTIIVNTGDDFWHYGLRVCPDLDTIMYTLSGLVDRTNGWGLANDSTYMMDALERFGEDPWFRLGDRDLATHVLRTHWLHEGATLTDVMHKAGYATGMFGKWHLGTQPQFHPQVRGFDEFYGFLAGAHSFLLTGIITNQATKHG